MDLGNEKIDVKCDCGRKYVVTLQDVINQKTIRCNCGVIIGLGDNDGSVKKGVTDINKAFKDLENTFKNLGR